MVRDITLGQYLPGKSVIHRLDARAKILMLLAMIVFIFVAGNFVSLSLMTLVSLCDFHGHYQSVLRYGRCVVGMGHYPHYTGRYP